MGLVLIQGGINTSGKRKQQSNDTMCTAQIGFANGKPVICNGQGYGYTSYKDVNGIPRRRVTVCRECEGSGKV